MEETKKCPFCGEEILAAAKKCKHCGEFFLSKNKKGCMRKLVLLLVFILFSAQTCLSAYVYKTEKLENGKIVRYCRFESGKIGFCTAQDEENFNYLTPEQRRELNKMFERIENNTRQQKEARTAIINKEIPFISDMNKKEQELVSEISAIDKKAKYGVVVNDEKLKLLNFQSSVIMNLFSTGLYDVTGTGERTNLNLLSDKFFQIYTGYTSGDITSEEYNQINSQLKEQANVFYDVYSRAMSLNMAPSMRFDFWVAAQIETIRKSKIKPSAAIKNSSKNFIKGVIKDFASPYGLVVD